jgi:hypothetical protein
MTFVGALVALALSAGCSPDYTAVRDWAARSRELVLPPAVADAPTTPPGARQDAAAALREAAGAWLGTLAYLAEDGQPAERENQLAPLAARVQPFDAEGAAAVIAIGDAIAYAARRNWRAPELAYAVDRADPAFQALLAALGRQSDALAAEQPDERAAVSARYAVLLGGRPTPANRAALEELRALREAEAARRDRADEARRAAIARIAAGHALLNERKRNLSQAETARLVRAQESELRRLALVAEAR